MAVLKVGWWGHSLVVVWDLTRVERTVVSWEPMMAEKMGILWVESTVDY